MGMHFFIYKGGYNIKSSSDINKLVTLSVLSAIGIILMAFIEIPYPFAGFLKIEFSDIVILIAFALFGFKSAFIVAIIKTVGDLLFQGVSGPYAIGQVTALVASLSYVFSLRITKLNLLEDGIKKILIKICVIILTVTCIMTISNYLFITPIFFGKFFWFQMGETSINVGGSFLLGVIVTYIPFNIIKGALTLSIFSIIGPRIVNLYNDRLKK